MNLQTQLRRLNLFGFSSGLRITDAVWVVFLVSRGFSLWQIGLAEGIFHVVSLLCEIPSGMAADLMGRRRALAAAGLCGIVSALLMAFTHSFFGVCLSMIFSALAGSFISGSDEALRLVPPRRLSLEQCLEFLADDELLEVTPENLRLRKSILNHEKRMKTLMRNR